MESLNIQNLFAVAKSEKAEEIFETLATGSGKFRIEKITSTGQITPLDEWYDQDTDEWVSLLQGKASILFEENNEVVELNKGDQILIKAHKRHRVIFTSKDPSCIWLAVHGNME